MAVRTSNIQHADVAVTASQFDVGGVDNFSFDSDFGLSKAKRGDKDGDEFDSNAFEFTGATTLTYKDVGSLEDAL